MRTLFSLLLLAVLVQLAITAEIPGVLEATGDLLVGHEGFLPPALNDKNQCDTSNSTSARYLTLPFVAGEEAVHIVEGLFGPGWVAEARVYVYTGEFDATKPCTNVNLTRTLYANRSFRIAMLLEQGEHTFVITSAPEKQHSKPGVGPFALRISVANFGGMAVGPANPPKWNPPILSNKQPFNCSNVGNQTAYLAHWFTPTQTGAHDVYTWLTGQPSANVRTTVYIFQGQLSLTAPDVCSPSVTFQTAYRSLGHFNDLVTIFLENRNYTIIVAFDFETPPTNVAAYGIQIGRSDRVNTNTTYAEYAVVDDPDITHEPENCTASSVLNHYAYIQFQATHVIHLFDFFETFDGNHTVLSVYQGLIGGGAHLPPPTCDNWLGSTRDQTTLPIRPHSLFLPLEVGQNYTVIVASQSPGVTGIFQPAVFTGANLDPTGTTAPPPQTTVTGTTGVTSHGTTGHATTTTTTTAAATTSTHKPHHHRMQGWQVALIVVGTIAGTGILVGAAAYYLLVVRRRPQYELIN